MEGPSCRAHSDQAVGGGLVQCHMSHQLYASFANCWHCQRQGRASCPQFSYLKYTRLDHGCSLTATYRFKHSLSAGSDMGMGRQPIQQQRVMQADVTHSVRVCLRIVSSPVSSATHRPMHDLQARGCPAEPNCRNLHGFCDCGLAMTAIGNLSVLWREW